MMAQGSQFGVGQAFNTLTQRERLFLYLVRRWARLQGGHEYQAQTTDEKAITKQRDVALSLFLECFAQALPEPFMVKPQRCRCSIQFHEATLLALFSGVSNGDRRAVYLALDDLMPRETIERLMAYIAPVISEVDVALDSVN